jgi:diacylglycerol kinase (ATP)
MLDDRLSRRGLLIGNPVAGERDPALIGAVVRYCSLFLDDWTVLLTAYRGHAEELAAKAVAEGVDVVVGVGGDGTICEIASGLARASAVRCGFAVPALMIIPTGTGNSFYREIWSDRPWQRAVDIGFTGDRPHIRRVDMARVRETDARFLLGACSGLVAEALVTVAAVTELHGRDRYREAVTLALSYFTPYPGWVSVDGRVVHEGTVVLANVGGGRYRGGWFKVLPHSILDDGLLDVCVVSGELDPRRLPGLTRDGGHVDCPEVVYERGRQVVIARTDGEPLTFEHDGELQSDPVHRYTLEVLPNVLSVIAPPEHA